MIYTITLNPSIDYFVFLEQKVIEGTIVRANTTEIRAGGKGINISMVLASIGIKTKAIMFLGGVIGQYIENEIAKIKEIELLKVQIDQENRINIKISNDQETAINAIGPEVTDKQQDDLLNKLDKLNKDDYVVISGSFCKGMTADLIESIGNYVSSVGAKLITDIPNLTLKNYQSTKPFLIKPNLDELASIFDVNIDAANYAEYVDRLIEVGVENVLVSMGKEGSYFANKYEKRKVNGPIVEVVNTVGCGDSMLAYTIAAMSQNFETVEFLKYGEAAGRAKAQTIGFPNMIDVKKMYEKVLVNKIK
ncbi:MAG: 1-phosphofructokinase family hexose kinase [Erysipelotrichaceae bacterium]|nr:1-phosphofructokinase family hexose kinase [Erysipelotrichaceae bacterium]